MSQKTIDIYWAVWQGERHIKALSEAAVWSGLKSYFRYQPDQHAQWSVIHERRSVQMVQGQYVEPDDWLDPHPHVTWLCPTCNRIHDADIDIGETGPGLWGCTYTGIDDSYVVDWDNAFA